MARSDVDVVRALSSEMVETHSLLTPNLLLLCCDEV